MSEICIQIPLDELVKGSATGVPCGGCQWMGLDPEIGEDGKCTVCGRDRAEIERAHGKVELTDDEKRQRDGVAAAYMIGDVLVYV